MDSPTLWKSLSSLVSFLTGLAMKSSSMQSRSQPPRRRFPSANNLLVGLIFLLLCVHSNVGIGQVADSPSASHPFVDPATLDPKIPTPSSVIGHEVGAKAVRYDPLMRYLKVLADSPDRITMVPYGKTYEGRTMVHLFITSPKNHRRLNQIKAGNGRRDASCHGTIVPERHSLGTRHGCEPENALVGIR